ncbi:MAG: glycosyltransferase family 2 protein [Bacteroidaceae bacterium]|nr:glycosyltransferase family 2 protein [Bacteroidaceae bacterium]
MDLTIVIPSYNRKALLRHTLSSIKRSPVAGVPIVVVDNASTDGTAEFLESYCSQNPDIRSVFEPNRNAAAARNRGLSMVSTRWVYFFDSDDEFEDIPHEWDDKAQLIAFPTRQKVEGKVSVRAYKPVSDPAVQILNSMLNTISMIFRTSWLKGIGGWNTDCHIWDDWELGCRALMASPSMQWITGKAYHTIKVHPDSLTGPNFSSRYKPQLDTIRQVLDDIHNTDTPDAARCRKALMLRTYILSGKLLHEGERKGSALCRTFIDESFGARPDGWILGRILEQYTAMGGRGAWRLAIWKMKRKSV